MKQEGTRMWRFEKVSAYPCCIKWERLFWREHTKGGAQQYPTEITGAATCRLHKPSQQKPDVEVGLYQQSHCGCELKGTEKTRGCWTPWILQDETMELLGRGCVRDPSGKGKKDCTGDFRDQQGCHSHHRPQVHRWGCLHFGFQEQDCSAELQTRRPHREPQGQGCSTTWGWGDTATSVGLEDRAVNQSGLLSDLKS